MSLDLSAFLDEFRNEANEHLRAIDAQLLALERDPDDPAPVRALFLAAHSLKGAGAMMDLADVEALAHAIEEVLARLRDGRQRLDGTTADLLFRARDLLGERVARAEPGVAPVDEPIEAMVAALHASPNEATAAPAPPAVPPVKDATGPVALVVEDSATVRLLHCAVLAAAGCAIDEVGDAAAALVAVATRHYDLLVIGMELADRRGPALIEALGVQLPTLPPIVLVGNDEATTGPTPPLVAAQILTAPPGQEKLGTVARQLLAQASR
jgi:chemotaxis protein histidine kinase CheA